MFVNVPLALQAAGVKQVQRTKGQKKSGLTKSLGKIFTGWADFVALLQKAAGVVGLKG